METNLNWIDYKKNPITKAGHYLLKCMDANNLYMYYDIAIMDEESNTLYVMEENMSDYNPDYPYEIIEYVALPKF